MDYRIFENSNSYPITLNAQEIEQPYLALQTLLANTPCEEFQQDVENLLHAIFKRHHWKKYDAPAYLYGTSKKVMKLLDILWLIDDCFRNRDVRSQMSYNERSLMHQYCKRSFKNLFKNTPADIEEIPKLEPYVILAEFFNKIELVPWRLLIHIWTSTALSSSYMYVLDDDFFGVTSGGFIQDYRCISEMIAVAYQLKSMEENSMTAKRLNLYKIFAIDSDYPQTFEEMEILDPRMTLDYPYFYTDAKQLPQAIKSWYRMLASKDHWENHNDPGNVLYLKDMMIQQVEAAWLLLMMEGNGYHTIKNNADMIDPSFLNSLSIEEQSNPFAVIEHFFEIKNLCVWKQLFEDWTYGSLTNKKEEELIGSRITMDTCDQLIKLLQALYLIDKRFD